MIPFESLYKAHLLILYDFRNSQSPNTLARRPVSQVFSARIRMTSVVHERTASTPELELDICAVIDTEYPKSTREWSGLSVKIEKFLFGAISRPGCGLEAMGQAWFFQVRHTVIAMDHRKLGIGRY